MEHGDMFLVHWPVKLKPWATNAVPEEAEFEPVLDLETTWGGMERCLDMGLCRSIGVSNFSTNKIQRLLDFASNPPAINQVMLFFCFSNNSMDTQTNYRIDRKKM
ncbi:hypothetical protein HYC85_001046 [Camellia sinensis]|uniref:NADP-dependent oxidoreductase domain-containing protein n=1 Tax=Camellia sinensis TaxID=4442 RepID=A0A7J7I5C0_CAMSI|nr:hypothetical protein HYC85_001046 [Camellia sinensis]